jgi:hypothetical protein
MSGTERKRTSILDPSLLQSITKAFSQSTPTTSSPSDQLAKLSVTTPLTSAPADIVSDAPLLADTEFVASSIAHLIPFLFLISQIQGTPAEQTPLLTLTREFALPTNTPRRTSNFRKDVNGSSDDIQMNTSTIDAAFQVTRWSLFVNEQR